MSRKIAIVGAGAVGGYVGAHMVQAGEDGVRFLLISGKPLGEPVAWYGPIVMNTQQQLQEAFTELREGTFLRN